MYSYNRCDRNLEKNHKKDKKEEGIFLFLSSGKRKSEGFKRRYRRLLC